VAETFWRLAQESLTNVERHAGARSVELRLEIAPAAAVLRVRDDGRGLPTGTSVETPGHYGLRGLRERVEGVGGELTLINGNGLTVEAKVPLI
jgi:signal transduction histidine kinase